MAMNDKPIAAGKSSFDLIDVEKFFAELNIRDNSSLLDLACGNGRYSIAMSELIGPRGTIYAIDLWEDGIDTLRKEIRSSGVINIQASVADVSKHIPVDDHSIDICLMATVLHDLIEDKTDRDTLEEVQRVLKKDGTLAIIEFQKINGPPGPPKAIRLSPEDLEKYLHSYSFRLIKTTDIGPYNYMSIYTY